MKPFPEATAVPWSAKAIVVLAIMALISVLTGRAEAATTIVGPSGATLGKSMSSWASKSTMFGEFGAGYNAGYELASNNTGSDKKAAAYASASGKLFGQTFSMASVAASAGAGLSDTLKGSFELRVLGAIVGVSTPNLTLSNSSLTIEKCGTMAEMSHSVVIVVVPVTLSLEAQGCVGVSLSGEAEYDSEDGESFMSLTGEPYVNIPLSASAGIGNEDWGFEVGVSASVDLIKCAFPITASLSFNPSTSKMITSITVGIEESRLSGTIELYAELNLFGLLELKYTYTLFEWDGNKVDALLFADSTPVARDVDVTFTSGNEVKTSWSYDDPGGVQELGSTYRWWRRSCSNGTNCSDTFLKEGTINQYGNVYKLSPADEGNLLATCVQPSNGPSTGEWACSGWIAVGHVATFYEHDNRAGSSVMLAYEHLPDGGCINLTDTSYAFDDKTSSFKWRGTSDYDTQMILYEHINCSGAALNNAACKGCDQEQLVMPSGWDNRVRSVRFIWNDSVGAANASLWNDGHQVEGSYAYGDTLGFPESGSTYVIQRADDPTGSTNVTTIGTDKIWTLVPADNEKYLRFCVTPRNGFNGTGLEICSSWRPVGPLLELYEDGNYGGSSVSFAYATYDYMDPSSFVSREGCVDLGYLGFANVLSSFKLRGYGNTPTTVQFYHDQDCTGAAGTWTQTIPNASYDASYIGNTWDDSISSFKIVTGLPSFPFSYSTLRAKHSGLCMDVFSNSSADGAVIWQYGCNNASAQQFAMVPSGDGYFYLVGQTSGKCVDVTNASTANNALIQQMGCTAGNTAQKFALIPDGNGYVSLKNQNSGKCIDVTSGSTAWGAQLQQYDCANVDTQKWSLTSSPTASFKSVLYAKGAGTVMTANAYSGVVSLFPRWENSAMHQFTLAPSNDGYYYLVNEEANKCAGVFNTWGDHHVVQQAECDSTGAQKFSLVPDGNGYYRIQNAGSGLCIGHDDTLMGDVMLEPSFCLDVDTHKWSLIPSLSASSSSG